MTLPTTTNVIRLAAFAIAVSMGGLFVRHTKAVLFHGVGISDGGGWAALLMAEFFACATALTLATYLHG